MSIKPHILVLTPWYLPGYKAGGPIRSVANMVAGLKDRFRFSVVTLNHDHADPEPYQLTVGEWVPQPDGSRVWYFSEETLSRDRLFRLIRQAAPDFIYLNSMYSLPFTIWPLWWKWQGLLPGELVLAPRGMLQEGAVGIKSWKKRPFLASLGFLGLQKKVIWHATDEQEAQDIEAFFGENLRIRLAPNLPNQQQDPCKSISKRQGELRLVFHSRISPKKNLEFIIGLLEKLKGEVRLDIYGPQEDAAYQNRCRESAGGLPEDKGVFFHGALPLADLRKAVSLSHFSVLPTLGENFGHAIFDGLLAGKPVLISDRTPWRDLETKGIGWDLPLEQPNRWTEVLQHLVDIGQPEYDHLSKAAWDFAAAYRQDPSQIERLAAVFS